MDSTTRTRLLIVDDNDAVRQALQQLLRSDFEIVGTLADAEGLEQAVQELCPDVVLLDIGMPNVNGFEAARRLIARCPDSKIIFVTDHANAEYLGEAIKTGALGYIAKGRASRDLAVAIRKVQNNERFFPNL